MPDGKKVFFVADPTSVPTSASTIYRRPDDQAYDGYSFRDVLAQYNRDQGDNPWGLLPAWQLYRHPVYADLAQRYGTSNLYILSAGWGLISAEFLTPNYDITFSANADPHKRRRHRERYEDFQQLSGRDFDRIIFAGGKDYVPMFLSLTEDFRGERVVFYNSASIPRGHDARFVRFETSTRTNWHYEWAHRLLDDRINLG